MERRYTVGKIESEDGMVFQITTGDVDRHNEVVDPNGLKKVPKSVPMYFNHDTTQLPLGKWVDIQRNAKGWTAKPDFDFDDEFATKIRNKVKNGYIDSVSIGFMPVKNESIDGRLHWTEWELLENSFAPIPANSNAVRIKSLDTAEGREAANKLAEWVEEKAGAVLSKVNEERLDEIIKNAQAIKESAKKEDGTASGNKEMGKEKGYESFMEELEAKRAEIFADLAQEKSMAKEEIAKYLEEAHQELIAKKAMEEELGRIYNKYGV